MVVIESGDHASASIEGRAAGWYDQPQQPQMVTPPTPPQTEQAVPPPPPVPSMAEQSHLDSYFKGQNAAYFSQIQGAYSGMSQLQHGKIQYWS